LVTRLPRARIPCKGAAAEFTHPTRVTGWSSDLGVTHFIDSVGPYKAALALGLGVVFGFTFDTAGPRRREVVEAPGTAAAPVPDGPVADEPIAHDRTPDA
jgi:hypothetical protein